MQPILDVHGLSKMYRIHHQAAGYVSLREKIQSVFDFSKGSTENFWALNDVSFEVQAGESLGIIGRNGAGKSTLLKILSRITPLSKGKIVSRGRVASLLEVGTGFHPELSGRENVFFNGSLLGMKRKEIETRFDEIVDFSGVEKFLDTPLKHYSSGMQLRLAFAVAAFLEPEILVIDEVLAVGDVQFQKKCLGKMEDVSKSGRTILFVSHNMASLKALCSRGIVLERGAKSYDGSIDGAVKQYLSGGAKEKSGSSVANHDFHAGSGELIVTAIDISTADDSHYIHTGDTINVRFQYNVNNADFDFTSCHVGIIIYDQNQNVIVSHTSKLIGIHFSDHDFRRGKEIIFTIHQLPLMKGTYSLSYNIVDQNRYLDSIENAVDFEVEEGLVYNLQRGYGGGLVAVRADWTIK
jgi:lipopolysaccharide transport system ATP-binding protein